MSTLVVIFTGFNRFFAAKTSFKGQGGFSERGMDWGRGDDRSMCNTSLRAGRAFSPCFYVGSGVALSSCGRSARAFQPKKKASGRGLGEILGLARVGLALRGAVTLTEGAGWHLPGVHDDG